ncbi:DUF2531 family protein [Klebsiella quasipneumoniae]|nr:DUF2531 family protein [Klebsiella quasipneumoniae]
MRINTRRTRAGLLILLAMGLMGGGVALWRDAPQPLAALSRDGAGWTGFLQDGSGMWRRVRLDEQLPTGWRVSRLTAGELDIVTLPGCEPPAWRWQREGKQDDAMDKPAASAATAGGGRRAK